MRKHLARALILLYCIFASLSTEAAPTSTTGMYVPSTPYQLGLARGLHATAFFIIDLSDLTKSEISAPSSSGYLLEIKRVLNQVDASLILTATELQDRNLLDQTEFLTDDEYRHADVELISQFMRLKKELDIFSDPRRFTNPIGFGVRLSERTRVTQSRLQVTESNQFSAMRNGILSLLGMSAAQDVLFTRVARKSASKRSDFDHDAGLAEQAVQFYKSLTVSIAAADALSDKALSASEGYDDHVLGRNQARREIAELVQKSYIRHALLFIREDNPEKLRMMRAAQAAVRSLKGEICRVALKRSTIAPRK